MFITTNKNKTLFNNEIENSFSSFNNTIISVGFLSQEKIEEFEPKIIKMTKKGNFKLIYGWTKNNVSKNLIDYLKKLNENIQKINKDSGIYISNDTFHGKIYSFFNATTASVYIGSSNFSKGGFYNNIECNIKIENYKECREIINFQNDLEIKSISDPSIKFSPINFPKYSLDNGKIDKKPSKFLYIDKPIEGNDNLEFFEYPIYDKSKNSKSNLNTSLAAPKNPKNPKERDPYEMQFIFSKKEINKSCYPEKDIPFSLIMDDNSEYTFLCSGDNGKNMSTYGDQNILGRWLKEKLLNKKIISDKRNLIKPEHIKKLNMKTLRFYRMQENFYKIKIMPFPNN